MKMFRLLLVFLLLFCAAVQSTESNSAFTDWDEITDESSSDDDDTSGQSTDDSGELPGYTVNTTTEAAQNTTNRDPSEIPVQVQPTPEYDPIIDYDEISGIQNFTVSDGTSMIRGVKFLATLFRWQRKRPV